MIPPAFHWHKFHPLKLPVSNEFVIIDVVVRLEAEVVLRVGVADALGVASVVVDAEDAAVAVVVGDAVVAVVGAAMVVAGGVLVGAVGEAVVVGIALLLATVKSERRLELVPSNHVTTALMVCDPSASFVVS
jgi:hypothetical protein